MISQWVTCFCLPPKKNIDQKTTTNRLTSVPTSNRLPRWVAWFSLFSSDLGARGIMWNSPTKIVGGSNLSNLAPLADYWNEPVTRKTSCMNVFSGTWKCFCVALMHVLRNLLTLCFSITHALKHHQSGIPFNASNQFLDLMTSISQSLQLLIHGKRLESNIAFETGHFKSSNPDSWVVAPVLAMPMSPRDLSNPRVDQSELDKGEHTSEAFKDHFAYLELSHDISPYPNVIFRNPTWHRTGSFKFISLHEDRCCYNPVYIAPSKSICIVKDTRPSRVFGHVLFLESPAGFQFLNNTRPDNSPTWPPFHGQLLSVVSVKGVFFGDPFCSNIFSRDVFPQVASSSETEVAKVSCPMHEDERQVMLMTSWEPRHIWIPVWAFPQTWAMLDTWEKSAKIQGLPNILNQDFLRNPWHRRLAAICL